MFMPPEWHPHRACLILYPHNDQVFRSSSKNVSAPSEILKCEPSRSEVRSVARAICDHGEEDVILFCNTVSDAKELERLLEMEKSKLSADEKTKNEIFVKVCPSDDSWCRDTGPTFVFASCIGKTKQLTGLDWKFNAYGGPVHGCYWPCSKDQALASNIISILVEHYSSKCVPLSIENRTVDLILEGGSFHTDGEGTILTTEECLLNKNRNPHLSKVEIAKILMQHLGATKVIWLPFGIAFDDDTNGHVDNIATFARPGEVVLSWTDDENNVNYNRFKAAEEVLLREVDAKGRKIKIHKLHIPNAMSYTKKEVEGLYSAAEDDQENGGPKACGREINQQLAASYVNYYMANKAVILPQFGDKIYDNRAEETIQAIFPDFKVIGVYSREILLGGGNIHCITQQMPA